MADSKPPEGNAPQLSLPAQARDAAHLVAGLPDHMFLSYESDDPRQRVSRIKAANNEILAGMVRIVTYLELNNPGAAEPLKARLLNLCYSVEELVAQEMPEYEGGKRREPPSLTFSPTYRQALELKVVAFALAHSIRVIAEEFEVQDGIAEATLDQSTEMGHLKKKVKQLEKTTARPKSARDKRREQQLKFIKPRIEKGCSWELIAEQYRKRYPKDRKVNSASLRLMWKRAQEKK